MRMMKKLLFLTQFQCLHSDELCFVPYKLRKCKNYFFLFRFSNCSYHVLNYIYVHEVVEVSVVVGGIIATLYFCSIKDAAPDLNLYVKNYFPLC